MLCLNKPKPGFSKFFPNWLLRTMEQGTRHQLQIRDLAYIIQEYLYNIVRTASFRCTLLYYWVLTLAQVHRFTNQSEMICFVVETKLASVMGTRVGRPCPETSVGIDPRIEPLHRVAVVMTSRKIYACAC